MPATFEKRKKMSKLNIAGSIATLLAVLAPLHAQSGTTSPGDFMAERVLPLTSIVAPTPPNLPDAVLAGIKAGAIEIHQRFIYNSAQRTLEQLAFVLPANSPVPFPDPSAAPLADHYFVDVESVTISTSPRPSVILSGHATSNDVPTPWGDITGAGITLTFGYRAAGASVQFGPVLESVSPLYGLYTDTGAGSLSLSPSPRKCGLNTLNGVYMFQLGGSIQNSTGWMPYSDSGRFQADGKGNIMVLDSGNIAGSAFTGRTFPISYTLNEECLGTFTLATASMEVQVSLDGKAINMVFTKPSSVAASGVGRLQ
jgi:hypothetical protein